MQDQQLQQQSARRRQSPPPAASDRGEPERHRGDSERLQGGSEKQPERHRGDPERLRGDSEKHRARALGQSTEPGKHRAHLERQGQQQKPGSRAAVAVKAGEEGSTVRAESGTRLLDQGKGLREDDDLDRMYESEEMEVEEGVLDIDDGQNGVLQ